jgi:hypothetical protein
LRANEALDFRWRQVRAAEGRLVPELLRFAMAECGPELLDAALEEFFVWDGVPEDYEQTAEFDAFFIPWFVYEFIADPHEPERIANAPDESLASLYLRRANENLSDVERAFLASASTNPLSFRVVTGTVPGREIGLRDVLTGDEVIVKERSASATVQSGALLFTRTVTVDGTSVMSGCAPLVIPPEWHLPILDLRARFSHGSATLTRDMVREIGVELRELYFQIEDRLLNPRMPELRNTDGDRLEFTTLFYRLRCAPQVAFDRLKPLARVAKRDAERLLADAERNERGELKSVTFSWSKRGNRMHHEWDNTALGTIAIDGERLQIDVNSRRRARRIEHEIARRLADDAVLESRTAEPVEELLEKRRTSPRDRLADREQEQLQQQPEVQEYLRQQGERHWEAWLDTRLPALGNRTPRQAARSPDGRERLEALLAQFAWQVSRSPNEMSPDIEMLRAKLGLT